MTHKKPAGCTSFWSKPNRTGIKKENKRGSSKLCNISRKHKMVKQEIKEKKESMNSTSTWEVTFYCSHWRKSEEVTGQSHSWNCEWPHFILPGGCSLRGWYFLHFSKSPANILCFFPHQRPSSSSSWSSSSPPSYLLALKPLSFWTKKVSRTSAHW